MNLPNLESTICQVLAYQSKEYSMKQLDVMNNYLCTVNKLQSREVYKTKRFSISNLRNTEIKLEALKIVTRYNKIKYNGGKRKWIKQKVES